MNRFAGCSSPGDPHTRAIGPIGVLERESTGYGFSCVERVLDTVEFRPFFGFDDLHRRYTSARLFPLFRQRLMGQQRPDCPQQLRVLALASDAATLAVLGRSGGTDESDQPARRACRGCGPTTTGLGS